MPTFPGFTGTPLLVGACVSNPAISVYCDPATASVGTPVAEYIMANMYSKAETPETLRTGVGFGPGLEILIYPSYGGSIHNGSGFGPVTIGLATPVTGNNNVDALASLAAETIEMYMLNDGLLGSTAVGEALSRWWLAAVARSNNISNYNAVHNYAYDLTFPYDLFPVVYTDGTDSGDLNGVGFGMAVIGWLMVSGISWAALNAYFATKCQASYTWQKICADLRGGSPYDQYPSFKASCLSIGQAAFGNQANMDPFGAFVNGNPAFGG